MSVRSSLLAILDQGPCYGYQLRAEFDRRTGGTWPLNVGQIYNTLDRLERDGLVVKGDSDAEGHVYYEITPSGSADVAEWLSRPVIASSVPRDELAIKIALAATLPGVDLATVLSDQLAASVDRFEALAAARGDSAPDTEAHADGDDPAGMAKALVLDSVLLHAEAEVRWLELAAARAARDLAGDRPIPLRATKPRRGRPARRESAAS
ncbi:PadR family transcriptional regulator [Planctomonas psychrotolerans]|uniref:PadR family transcriptional regulator n=1 Tax=Planctomonas psychrotolerans TaxID=2528712 RepID=UPI00123B8640|nr:PadR family transcriptional regulator [Planctomonas psychrotolerans]